ncbi:MAG: protein phosphatase CheZ [Syntrophobacteraceae bacterium]
MIELDAQDMDELVKLLQEAEQSVSSINGTDGEKEMEKSRRALVAFHTTAAMLGLGGLEKVGVELETFLSGNVAAGFSLDSVASLGFAIGSVIDAVKALKEGKGEEELELDEIRELLSPLQEQPANNGVEAAAGAMQEFSQTSEAVCEGLESDKVEGDLRHLREIIRSLGGELLTDSDEHSGGTFRITFTGSADTLRKIEKLVCDGQRVTTGALRAVEETVVETVVGNVHDIINAISSADMDSAQKILLRLAETPKSNTGLYKEIGTLARGLHDSILSFFNTLDPSLHELVMDKIPDSGNRLEHILEMTEKAALTTLDHVEAIQDRLVKETEQIAHLREVVGGLKAVGDSAGKKLDESMQTLEGLEKIINEHRSDLDIIMGAQDYQDLSGQVIHKITKLLKDIEGKLVNLIRTFGARPETSGVKTTDELYGPAHAAMENAVHSQDEVDSLLSEFGF